MAVIPNLVSTKQLELAYLKLLLHHAFAILNTKSNSFSLLRVFMLKTIRVALKFFVYVLQNLLYSKRNHSRCGVGCAGLRGRQMLLAFLCSLDSATCLFAKH